MSVIQKTIEVRTILSRGVDGAEFVKARNFTSIGCYPLLYISEGRRVLCPDCALECEGEGTPMDSGGVNWEDPSLFCDECSERIESAYAEDDVT